MTVSARYSDDRRAQARALAETYIEAARTLLLFAGAPCPETSLAALRRIGKASERARDYAEGVNAEAEARVADLFRQMSVEAAVQ
jgi:hypothetical protein